MANKLAQLIGQGLVTGVSCRHAGCPGADLAHVACARQFMQDDKILARRGNDRRDQHRSIG